MAGYARQVYEDYGVLMFWENESVNENLKKYIRMNIELGDVEHKGSNLLMTRLKNIKAKKRNMCGVTVEKNLSGKFLIT